MASVLAEYFKTNERTVFWDYELNRNVDPFESLQTGFFSADWDFKVRRHCDCIPLSRNWTGRQRDMLADTWNFLAQNPSVARRLATDTRPFHKGDY